MKTEAKDIKPGDLIFLKADGRYTPLRVAVSKPIWDDEGTQKQRVCYTTLEGKDRTKVVKPSFQFFTQRPE